MVLTDMYELNAYISYNPFGSSHTFRETNEINEQKEIEFESNGMTVNAHVRSDVVIMIILPNHYRCQIIATTYKGRSLEQIIKEYHHMIPFRAIG